MKDLLIGLNNLNQARRKAGKVKRYHTESLLQPAQTLSDHIFNMLRIWTSLWGDPPPEVTMQILFHDFEELILGDIPHWAAEFPALKEAYHDANGKVRELLGVPAEIKDDRMHIVDQIEALEFMVDEVLLGNHTLVLKLHKLGDVINQHLSKLLPEESRPIYDYLKDMGIDLKDFPHG